jgi:hypothetical protein
MVSQQLHLVFLYLLLGFLPLLVELPRLQDGLVDWFLSIAQEGGGRQVSHFLGLLVLLDLLPHLLQFVPVH